MRKNWIMMGVMTVVAFGCWVSGAPSQGTHPTRDFMRHKLGYNQGIVEGIALEKYELIVTNATALRNMSLTNAYLALKNPDYLDRIANFQQRVDRLIEAAREKNLEKSTQRYSEMIASCVACHKSFRLSQLQREVQ